MLSEDVTDSLVAACTDVAGDALRSIVYFTADEFDQLLLRDYLSAEADIQSFVENERVGFDRIPTHDGSELGRYRYTLQRFDAGYLLRVVTDTHGVFVTTNQLSLEEYDALATAVQSELED